MSIRGLKVAAALLAVSVCRNLFGASDVSFSQSAPSVEAYDFVEVTLNVTNPDAPNPFTNAVVSGFFQKAGSPTQIPVDGFCDSAGGSVYRIRFMPQSAGSYSYFVKFNQGNFERTQSGTFEATDGRRRGLVRVDAQYPWHFQWQGTGEHYFWNGTTTYWLAGWDEPTIQASIDRLSNLKVNRLRVLLYGRSTDLNWDEPVKTTANFKYYLNPWVAKQPDNVSDPQFDTSRFNVGYWQKYERLLRYARERDLIISVIFFVGNAAQVISPYAAYSEEEKLYYQYAVARLGAFSNVSWDLGNEHDIARGAPAWGNWMGAQVKIWDPYDHLTSAHNFVYRGPDTTWIDMQLIQRWDTNQNAFFQIMRFGQSQTAPIRIVPQVNEEYGYEDSLETTPGLRNADSRRRLAWEIYLAGCYQTTGETGKRGTGLAPDTGGGWVNGRGDNTMTMLDGYAHIVNFFTRFEWWKMDPRNDLVSTGYCLALPGTNYVVYLPTGGPVEVDLRSQVTGAYNYKWFNPRTGVYSTNATVAGGDKRTFNAPDTGTNDWALQIGISGVGGNSSPAIRIRTPTNGQLFNVPTNIAITAEASDVDGAIGKVEFFQGTTLLGEATGSPFTLTWSNVTAPGAYLLTAKATDNEGATTLSAPVQITLTSGSTSNVFSLIGPLPYLSQNDSPFKDSIASGATILETFEDGLLNVPGVTASAGQVIPPPFAGLNDSVDGDDGVIDGRGTGGHSFFWEENFITFTFNAGALGGSFPTHAGVVWTDGKGLTTFEAFDATGASLGVIGPVSIADGEITGQTAEDRFFGVTNPGGVSAIKISNTEPGIEVDHLQYGTGAPVDPPAPPRLNITRTGDPDFQFQLSWEISAEGYVLEGVGSLSPPITWRDVGVPPVVSGNRNTVRGNTATGVHFYRLRRP